LSHLNAVGYRGAPRTLGFDDRGRHVLEYIEGNSFIPVETSDDLPAIRRVGKLIRDFHDASAGFTPPLDARWNVAIRPDTEDLIVHHALAPRNLVLGTDRWVFLDWDNAGPGSRLWDLAYAAYGFIPLAPDTPISSAARRLAALADGYGLEEQGRRDLAALLVPRMMRLYDLLREGRFSDAQPWARLWEKEHGHVVLANARYARANHDLLWNALTHSK
jgi:aminoglycoside phosphotransferase (APT) family kinase protein